MPEQPPLSLGDRLEAIATSLGERESEHREALEAARAKAKSLHRLVAAGLERFHAAVERAGAPHLQIELSQPRVDDKHLRAGEFELSRGKHMAVVTVKSRGHFTLVGPFSKGKPEGPCQRFPFSGEGAAEVEAELEVVLGAFLASFLEKAATP